MIEKVPSIKLTQMQISPFCDKVRRVLFHKGLAYETHDIKVTEIGALKKMASNAKVPILDYGEQRLCDSTDICLWLEEKHPQPALLPDDPAARADVLLLEDWADETLYFFEMTMRFAWPEDSRRWSLELAKNDGVLVRMLAPFMMRRLTRTIVGHQGAGRRSREQVFAELHRLFGALEVRIGAGGFCVGDTLSLADISIASQIHCIQGSRDGAFIVSEHPTLADWKRRVDALTCPA